jgi:hypothetical protein
MWHVISNVLIVLSLLSSFVAIFFAVRSAVRGAELQQAWRAYVPSVSRSLETRLSELEDAVAVVANRVKMTKVRNAATHTDRDKGGEPDARLDPEAWRTWKNAQLRAGQYNS